ncbi:hypothetical protein OCK74_18875 [Chitinophagaceae bacterium LB-8]|uniref:Uncharacterized protein n=1 Tax=Paraflavisolibacter caeni TaxID=2982496 RepID=A0A9X2XYV9_9BACT|nr:hypothetical protein [Paraflavisolibacter caeni]MCU7551192.1 hypothetical protein [Paraflavisolibacter caeni]
MNATIALMKKAVPKRIVLFLLAGFICLSTTAAVLFANADLSGEWKLNEQKSELGQFGGRMAARKLKVSSQADAISIERTSVTQNGEERTTSEKLTFDGKETETTVFGNNKKKSTAKWSDDGQTLNINSVMVFDRNGEQMEIKVAEAWKLTENGQVLSVESTSTSSRGTNTLKLVYEKAK